MLRAALATAAALAAFAVLAIGTGASSETRGPAVGGVEAGPQLPVLLGFQQGKLVRIDPRSLRAKPGRSLVSGSGGCAPRNGGTACWTNPPWAVSPDGRTLALAGPGSLRIIDPRTLRVTSKIPYDGSSLGALAWLDPGRVLALQERPAQQQRLLVFDVAKRRVVEEQPLGGQVQRLAASADKLVALLGPVDAVGPARMAVADAQGAVRFVELPRILAGSKRLAGPEFRIESRLPGLSVDPEGNRAFVVEKGLAAEIDLGTLAVSYHDLDRESSFLSSVLGWLDPVAAAKEFDGQIGRAEWLGHGLLAVSGSDTVQDELQPAGLVVVDTRSWNIQTLNPDATDFTVAGDALLATGGRWDEKTGRTTGIGLVAYGLDGKERYQLYAGQQAWLTVFDRRVYVGLDGFEGPRVVDLATGTLVGSRSTWLPWLLLGRGDGWWGPI